jgi:hypothetical protein
MVTNVKHGSQMILKVTIEKNKNMKDQNINEKDVKHLQWLYDRMANVHGENKDYDYMIKFKEIIEQLKK